jgi:hypothetical protein
MGHRPSLVIHSLNGCGGGLSVAGPNVRLDNTGSPVTRVAYGRPTLELKERWV